MPAGAERHVHDDIGPSEQLHDLVDHHRTVGRLGHPMCPTNNPNAIDARRVSAVIPISDKLWRTSRPNLPGVSWILSAIPTSFHQWVSSVPAW
jgi:hypothetical protein